MVLQLTLLAASEAAVTELVGQLPDYRQRVCQLRLDWQRGERLPATPDPRVYAGRPHQVATGYLTDGARGLVGARAGAREGWQAL